MLVNVVAFVSGYVLIKGGTFINFFIFLFFKYFFFTFFPLAMCKKIKLSVILRRAMVIQGAMFIVFANCSRGYVYSRGYIYSGV